MKSSWIWRSRPEFRKAMLWALGWPAIQRRLILRAAVRRQPA